MIVSGYWDGLKEQVSAKGNRFADLYFRAEGSDGNADFEQTCVRTFDEATIKSARGFNRDDIVYLDLKLRDATCVGISK